MQQIATNLSDLEPEAVARVLRWAGDRFKVPPGMLTPARLPLGDKPSTREPGDDREVVFEDFAGLYNSAKPSSDSERALVAGFWFQELQGQKDLDSQRLNTALKELGHGLSNITDSLQKLIEKKPNLVMQTRKSGTTKQARKRYRLTAEGVQTVKRMMSGKPSEVAGNGDEN
jgi:hypothetical protein